MRKIKKSFLLLVLVMCIFCIGGFMGSALPVSGTEFFLVTTTPGVDSSTEMRFNWHAAKKGSYLYYYKALEGEESGTRVDPTTEVVWSTRGQENVDTSEKFYTARFVCTAEVTGLEPRTKYCYYIANETSMSKTFSFTTAGMTNSWEFIAFVDFQNPKNDKTKTIINQVAKKTNDPCLAICSGDLTGCGGNQSEFEWLLESNFNNYVFAAAPGDHEYWANDDVSPYPMFKTPYGYNAVFNNPKNGCEESLNSNYYFYWNNVLFVALDMCDSNTSKCTKLDKEAAWFDQTMAKLAGTYQYCVVFEHKSLYGSTNEDSGVRKYIGPVWHTLFDKYNVDLSIGGHDHMYSRTYQVYNDKVSTDYTKGTYYLDMGSSGQKFRTPGADLTTDGLHETVLDLKALQYGVGSRIIVTEEKMEVQVININGVMVDNFEIKAKRSASSVNQSGFDKDAFENEFELNAKSSSLAYLELTKSNNVKYIKNITVLDKDSAEVLNHDVAVNTDSQIKFDKVNDLNYTVKVTLLNGEQYTYNKSIAIGSIESMKASVKSGKLNLTINNQVNAIGNIQYKLTVDGEVIDITDKMQKKGLINYVLSDDCLYGSHQYKLELMNNNEVIQSLELTHREKYELELLTEGDITLNVGKSEDIYFDFDDIDKLTITSSDENVVTIDDVTMTAVGSGTAKITLSIEGTKYSYSFNVNVPEVTQPAKTGCNSGSVIQTLSTVLLAGLGLASVALFTAFRRKREE